MSINKELEFFKDLRLPRYNVSIGHSNKYGFYCKVYDKEFSYVLYNIPENLVKEDYKILDLLSFPNKYTDMTERKFLKHIKYDVENYYLGEITYSNNFQDLVMPYVNLFSNRKNSFVNINETPDLHISYIDISDDIINKYPDVFGVSTYAIKYVIFDKSEIVNFKAASAPFYRVFDLNAINILNLDLELEKDFKTLETALENEFIENTLYYKPFDVLEKNKLCSVDEYINYVDLFELNTYKYLQTSKARLRFLENRILTRVEFLLEHRDLYNTELMTKIAEKDENIIYKI